MTTKKKKTKEEVNHFDEITKLIDKKIEALNDRITDYQFEIENAEYEKNELEDYKRTLNDIELDVMV